MGVAFVQNDSIYYERGEWPHTWRINSFEQIDNGSHPCIACDGANELIAYQKDTMVKFARACHRRRGLAGLRLRRPRLGPRRTDGPMCLRPSAGTGRRLYLGATGYRSSGARFAFVSYSSDGGTNWKSIRSESNGVFAGTDSVSLCAQAFGSSSFLRNRVWAIATGHTSTDPVSKSIIVRVASEFPIEVGPPASTDAFGGNSARRVTRQPGTDYLHRAIPIENYISYERSSDNGETWDFQDAPDFGTSPRWPCTTATRSSAICGMTQSSALA